MERNEITVENFWTFLSGEALGKDEELRQLQQALQNVSSITNFDFHVLS